METLNKHSNNSAADLHSTKSSGLDRCGVVVLDECLKKRCLDRYDSSESSDSGVALLSGSNCDLSDPYSPSNSSSLSSSYYNEDTDCIKMPPTVTEKTSRTTTWLSFINLISDDRTVDDDKIDDIFSKLPPINHNNNNIILKTKDEIEAPSVSSVISVVKANKLSQQHRKQQRERPPPQQQQEKDQKITSTTPTQQATLLSTNTCLWKDCGKQFGSSGNLFEHLQVSHILSQANEEHYICYWTNCKVYNKPSCSRSWLERHVLSHGGKRPFKCIVDGCGAYFSTQILLERHVNSHFNNVQTSVNNQNISTKNNNNSRATKEPAVSISTTSNGRVTRTQKNYNNLTASSYCQQAINNHSNSNSNSVAVKVSKKSSKRVRLRRQQPSLGRNFDFFDDRIMGVISQRLAMNYYPMSTNSNKNHKHKHNYHHSDLESQQYSSESDSETDESENFIELRSCIKGQMTDAQGTKSVLLRWFPENILPDEWVLEHQMEHYRTILKCLPKSVDHSSTSTSTSTSSQSSSHRRKYPRRHYSSRS